MVPSPKRRRGRSPRPSPHHLLLLKAALLLLLLLLLLHATTFLLPRANSLGRVCLPVTQTPDPASTRPRIAIVSFSDGGSIEVDGRQRSFRGLMAMVTLNKEEYARRWGYRFLDAGDSIDPQRPASWSKILAVRRYLDGYDWMFWNDADSIVTNPDITLETVLQSALGRPDYIVDSPDLVVTEDVNGVNAGMWFIRRSTWSKAFLDAWWNQSDFVRFGSTRSGDNAALIHLIRSMSPMERQLHVRVAPAQCSFNSYPWTATWKNGYRLITSPRAIWRGVYSDGDFMVHLAGFDDKRHWTARILRDLEQRDLRIFE